MRIQYNKLWKILIDKNMKKVDLRDAAEISKVEDLFETVKDENDENA